MTSCEEYVATSEILIHQRQPHELYDSYLPDPVPADVPGFLKSDAVIREVMAAFDYATQWKLDDAEAVKKLRTSIQADFKSDTGVLDLSASSSNPEEARQIVNSFAEAFCVAIEKQDWENRLTLLNSLQEVVLKQSDVMEDLRKDRTVLVHQYGADCYGDLVDPSNVSDEAEFQVARTKFEDLKDRKMILVARVELYRAALSTEPTRMETVLLEEAEKELEKVENEIEDLTQLAPRGGDAPIDISLIKLNFQYVDQNYQYHWGQLNEIRSEQRRLRLLLKLTFKPATISKRA
ncbi:hypothetical protein N9891_00570 [bacterium]|nr:hypothetical protein [bacterium]